MHAPSIWAEFLQEPEECMPLAHYPRIQKVLPGMSQESGLFFATACALVAMHGGLTGCAPTLQECIGFLIEWPRHLGLKSSVMLKASSNT